MQISIGTAKVEATGKAGKRGGGVVAVVASVQASGTKREGAREG